MFLNFIFIFQCFVPRICAKEIFFVSIKILMYQLKINEMVSDKSDISLKNKIEYNCLGLITVVC